MDKEKVDQVHSYSSDITLFARRIDVLIDTDGARALDGWAIELGFDPAVFKVLDNTM